MTRNDMETRAAALMKAGCNCAESLLTVAKEAMGIDAKVWPTRVATCFGGGLGRIRQELCGALAGAVMGIGLASGRDQPETTADLGLDLTAIFRESFIALHGSSQCGTILEGFGEQENWEACRQLVAKTAGLLYDALVDAGGIAPEA